ncbi:MAG TPA: hypothetical protein VK553_06475, partial [Candidatus Nitrosopolaris rasttigaisensis]|nr:hypothetical protein [Candidatus Nitrosopolaris rasttigaisensis]
FKKGKMDNVLKQTLPFKIEIDDIEDFKEGNNVDLWLHVIGVKLGFTASEKHIYGAKLIGGIIELILGLGEKGITIGTMAARSNTSDGIRLMRRAGFTEVPPATPERRTFIINVNESGIPYVMQYKEKLSAWKERDNLSTSNNGTKASKHA